MTVAENIGPSCRTGLSWVRGVVKQVVDFVQPAVDFLKPVVRKVSAVALGVGALLGFGRNQFEHHVWQCEFGQHPGRIGRHVE